MNATALHLRFVHLKLGFLGDNSGLATYRCSGEAGDWTEMSARTDHEPRRDSIVRDPPTIGPLEAHQTLAEKHPCPGSSKQIVVELAAANAVAYDLAITCFDRFAAYPANAKTRDRLENAAVGILVGIDFQYLEDLRCDPSAAYFISREILLVEDNDIEIQVPQPPRARRACRSTSYDQDIAGIHSQNRSFVYSGARVQG